jgi:hypothetical protein
MHASTTKIVHMSPMDTIAAVWGPAGALTHLHYLATTAEKQANLFVKKQWIFRNYSRLATQVGRGHTAAGWLWLAPRDASTNCRPAQS